MLRAIREIHPRWVVGENVFGILNWSDGLVFEQVCADLETEGYEVQTYVLPAAGVGAPHKRDRVWFVAHAQGVGLSSNALRNRISTEREVQINHGFTPLCDVIAHDFRSESHKHGVVDGIPVGLDECSIKAYGNAIVPKVAYQIFETINHMEAADAV